MLELNLHLSVSFVAGGRIIARYEAPTLSFLFPQERQGSSEALPPLAMQTVAMNKSRKYEVSCTYTMSCDGHMPIM